MRLRPLLALLLTLGVLAPAGFAQTPTDPSAVEPGDAPRTIPTPAKSSWATPGYKQRPTVAARVPYESTYPYKNPGPAVLARHGAVACVSAVASQVGVDVLKRGGTVGSPGTELEFAL